MSTPANKGDINLQIGKFVARLKRRQISGSKDVALATARLLERFVSSRRYTTAEALIQAVRELGARLEAAQPLEFTCGTVVRRVLKNMRTVDEAVAGAEVTENTVPAESSVNSSMFGLLSAPKPTKKDAPDRSTARDQKAAIMDEIQGLIDEINNDDPLFKVGADMITDNDSLLVPCPMSRTMLEFLLKTAHKRRFSVIVTECYPNFNKAAENFAEKLKRAGIPVTIIADSMVYAVMSKVSKVIISSKAILANGGCITASGMVLPCLAAREFARPVLAVAATYKLSPVYPYDIESLIEIGNSEKVIDFSESDLVEKLEVVNPLYDYIAPELMDIIITTDGGYSPNFVYRIVLDNYSPQDQSLEGDGDAIAAASVLQTS